MNKANEPAYPTVKTTHEYGMRNGITWDYGNVKSEGGLSKREKLAMEIYSRMLLTDLRTPKDLDADELLETCAKAALRAADIFFEQLNK